MTITQFICDRELREKIDKLLQPAGLWCTTQEVVRRNGRKLVVTIKRPYMEHPEVHWVVCDDGKPGHIDCGCHTIDNFRTTPRKQVEETVRMAMGYLD